MMRIGIDLGGTATKVGLVTDKGQISAFRTFPTPTQQGAEEVLRQIAQQCLALCEEKNIKIEDIDSVGFGTPGFVDRENAIILYSANLQFENVPIRSLFKSFFPHTPVLVENDANCAAIAESVFGAARDAHNSVTLTLGTGVGAGVILDGRIFHGYENLAPEIGHLIIQADGEPCPCGRRGCMERYISANALVRHAQRAAEEYPESLLAQKARQEPISAKMPFDVAEAGDATAKKVVEQYIEYLAVSISNVIYAFGPEIVLLGGGICNEGDRLLVPLRAALDRVLMPGSCGKTQIGLAQFRNEAGVVGSSVLHLLGA